MFRKPTPSPKYTDFYTQLDKGAASTQASVFIHVVSHDEISDLHSFEFFNNAMGTASPSRKVLLSSTTPKGRWLHHTWSDNGLGGGYQWHFATKPGKMRFAIMFPYIGFGNHTGTGPLVWSGNIWEHQSCDRPGYYPYHT